jgi:hypothetical protein
MAKARNTTSFTIEFADFLASQPTREQWLAYSPPEHWQRRASELLQKQNDGDISREEERELEEFAQTERLIRLIKARLHSKRTTPS